MPKIINYFFLLFCTFFIVSGCTNTSSKQTANNMWDDPDLRNVSLIKPNLTGVWILNGELSDNPQAQVKKRMRKSANSGGNKSMNGRGDGDHRGNGKGNGGKQGKAYSRNKKNTLRHNALPQELHVLLIAAETLELKHEEPLLSILTKAGQEEIYTDFRSSSVSSNHDLNQKVTIAGWENNSLVVENTLSSGRFIQQFTLDSTSGQLWIDTLITTSHLPKPLKFRRIYERINPDTK